MICVVRRFRVFTAPSEVVQATRDYQALTRREPGNVRCELWQAASDSSSFTLLEVFRDEHARAQHSKSEHARAWLAAVTPLLSEGLTEEHGNVLLSERFPPPLPASQRPAIESSSPFGGTMRKLEHPSPPLKQRLRQLTIDVEAIEVAAAKDHIPWFTAQPCTLLGAFLIGAERAQGLGRSVYRFAPPRSLPASMTGTQRLIEVPLPPATAQVCIGIVLLSVEENGGHDVRALYQALADAQDLAFWTRGENCPAPCSLSECAGMPVFNNQAQRVEVLYQQRALADTLQDDTWAGASAGCFEFTARQGEHVARFHTAAEDAKNDWLLTLRARVD